MQTVGLIIYHLCEECSTQFYNNSAFSHAGLAAVTQLKHADFLKQNRFYEITRDWCKQTLLSDLVITGQNKLHILIERSLRWQALSENKLHSSRRGCNRSM